MGATISLFFLMFRLLFLALRCTPVVTVWTFQATVLLMTSLIGGGARRVPRLRL